VETQALAPADSATCHIYLLKFLRVLTKTHPPANTPHGSPHPAISIHLNEIKHQGCFFLQNKQNLCCEHALRQPNYEAGPGLNAISLGPPVNLLPALQDSRLQAAAELKHKFKIAFYLLCPNSFKSQKGTVLQSFPPKPSALSSAEPFANGCQKGSWEPGACPALAHAVPPAAGPRAGPTAVPCGWRLLGGSRSG